MAKTSLVIAFIGDHRNLTYYKLFNSKKQLKITEVKGPSLMSLTHCRI